MDPFVESGRGLMILDELTEEMIAGSLGIPSPQRCFDAGLSGTQTTAAAADGRGAADE